MEMVNEFEIWLYRGVIAMLLMVMWWAVQNFAKKVQDNFSNLIKAVNEQSNALTEQTTEMRNLTRRVDSQDGRLNDHSRRIRNIEQKGNKEKDG